MIEDDGPILLAVSKKPLSVFVYLSLYRNTFASGVPIKYNSQARYESPFSPHYWTGLRDGIGRDGFDDVYSTRESYSEYDAFHSNWGQIISMKNFSNIALQLEKIQINFTNINKLSISILEYNRHIN